MHRTIPRSLQEAHETILKSPEIAEACGGSDLELIHVYKAQICAIAESGGRGGAGQSAHVLELTYNPFPELWQSFFYGNQVEFRKWAERELPKLVTPDHPGFQLAFSLDSTALIQEVATRTEGILGVRPSGRWHFFFGPHGDMGGSGDGTMWANLSVIGNERDPTAYIEFLLPHEFSHLVLRKTQSQRPTVLSYTLLHLILEEGLCSFFNYMYWKQEISPARNILFTDEDWRWCVAQEREIAEHASLRFASVNWRTINTYHRGDMQPWPDAPSRLAYFLGFRICQAYVREHGTESWKDIYHQSAQETLVKSHYLERLDLM